MLGVCYYPEHWGSELLREDARRMRALGLRYVRIGEFSWSRIEPRPEVFAWSWMDEAIEELGRAGLRVVVGTPTATPPKWLLDRSPEILPIDREGRIRAFGSRRHYCFSSPAYQEETRRIVTCFAERYGDHPAVVGWQTDNEFGCHDTVRCYCARCQTAFQCWLAGKYTSVSALNAAWGTAFWSQEYGEFSEVPLPNLTVTEPHPAHVLDYFRFASDQVAAYNRMQVEILRARSPGRHVTHNFMGYFTDFDHFAVAKDLDHPSWDSYPLGFTEVGGLADQLKLQYAHSGHPDVAAFNHDLYRGMGRGRFWVMEQQPGPVNWAPHNPSPAPGMVRLWTWEALAHGADVVSYFRWRQAPFAQEQMHTGLLRPDSSEDRGFREAGEVATELSRVALSEPEQAPVALVFDYEAAWVFGIQPHGRDFGYLDLVFAFYTSLRSLGLDVDIVSRAGPFDGYRLVAVPSLPILRSEDVEALCRAGCPVVCGPRTGSKTPEFQIPDTLPPGSLQEVLPLRVLRVASLRPGLREQMTWHGKAYEVARWREWVDTELPTEGTFEDGGGAVVARGHLTYVAFWPSQAFLEDLLEARLAEAGQLCQRMPEGLRLRRRGNEVIACNYAQRTHEVPAGFDAQFLVGGRHVPPHGVSVWRER